jgi:hypothetical protein
MVPAKVPTGTNFISTSSVFSLTDSFFSGFVLILAGLFRVTCDLWREPSDIGVSERRHIMSCYDILFLWSLQALTFTSESVNSCHAEPIGDGICVHEGRRKTMRPLQHDVNIESAKLFLERDT